MNEELLYKEEHTSCFMYEGHDDPTITHVCKEKGDVLEVNENYNRVFFLLKGEINFIYENTYIVFKEGTFILLPRGCKYTMNIKEDASIIIVNVHYNISFCEHFTLKILHQLNKHLLPDNSLIYPLKINTVLSIYLSNIAATIAAGLKCSYFHEIKQRELFYYLRAYYCKNELAAFFLPMLNDDMDFAEQIYQNYASAKNIVELANGTNYSISGFKKRFVKVFGISPYHWMEKEKAKKIHHEINCTHKTFKEIFLEYDFCSASHFNTFCKKMYGVSPAALRKNTMCVVSFEKELRNIC